MIYFWPDCPSSQKSNVLVALIAPGRRFGGCTVPGGTTKRVMLWGGNEFEIAFPERETLLKCVITLDEVSCHACALLPGRKLERLIVADTGVTGCLLMTIT